MNERYITNRDLIKECWHYAKHLLRYNASVHTDDDRQKMEYTLLRESHVLEKGLSLKAPKRGFGQAKVSALMDRLMLYHDRYGIENPDFLMYPLGVIKSYLEYQSKMGVDIRPLKQMFGSLLDNCGLTPDLITVEGGTFKMTREEIQKVRQIDFEGFVRLRHSIRNFTGEMPNEEMINKALEIASLTPSVCNRQGWKTHVFRGDAASDLLVWHSGAKGFEDCVHLAILITSDSKAFLRYEPHQAFVDGGMYAMSLIYALHSQGLGTIPLSCGVRFSKLDELRKQFDIPENEEPIVIIGVGVLPEEFSVAVSKRKNISETNIDHVL